MMAAASNDYTYKKFFISDKNPENTTYYRTQSAKLPIFEQPSNVDATNARETQGSALRPRLRAMQISSLYPNRLWELR